MGIQNRQFAAYIATIYHQAWQFCLQGGKKNVNRLQEASGDDHFRVAIFGSARIQEDEGIYRLVHNLAKLIGGEGIDLVTGGGPGLMEAASKGHREGRRGLSAHSIGLNIKLPQGQAEAAHLDIKEDFARFSDRLDHFMILSNAVVVAPGGVGTLLELVYTWQLMQVKHICDIPIILMGEMWKDFLEWVRNWPLEKQLLDPKDVELLYLTRTCEEAFTVVKEAYRTFLEGGEDFCLNFHLYKLD
jgi:uncharacterized protein (TIGR00730 family)